MTPSPSTSVASKNVVGDEPEDADTPEEETVEVKKMKMTFPVPPSKKKKQDDTPVARVGRKKGKGTGDCSHSVFAGNVRHASMDAGEADES